MEDVLRKSRFIAVLVFLVLVFHVMVRAFMQLDDYIDDRSILMLQTGVHLFVCILFLIFMYLLHQQMPRPSAMYNLVTFGQVCYWSFMVAELAALRLSGLDNSPLVEKLKLTAFALYIVIFLALTVFYLLLGIRLPMCGAKVAAFFVAAAQVVNMILLELFRYWFDLKIQVGGVDLYDFLDDVIAYGCMIWLLIALPNIPLKKNYA